MRWLAAAGALVAYVVLSLWLSDANPFLLWHPHNMRELAPVLIALGAFFKYYRPRVTWGADGSPAWRDAVNAGNFAGADAGPAKRKTAGEVKAKGIARNALPETEWSVELLRDLLEAAKAGDAEARSLLGEYAWRHGAFVEAFFWYSMADELEPAAYRRELGRVFADWRDAGCPGEFDNVRKSFNEYCGSYARALLRVRAGIDVGVSVRMAETLRPYIRMRG